MLKLSYRHICLFEIFIIRDILRKIIKYLENLECHMECFGTFTYAVLKCYF